MCPSVRKTVFLFVLSSFLVLLPLFVWAIEEDQPFVTNAFFETDIREVLRDISAQTGVKIVADETVQGSVTIEFNQVPLEEALRMVLSVGNFAFHRMPEGYYLVGLCTPNSPSFSQLSITDYYRPNYIKVRELQGLISEFYQPYLKINEENNVITITAAPEVVRRLKEDLLKLDQPQNQVMIEALVVELSQDGKESLGVTWGSMLDGGFSIYPPSTFEYTKAAGVKGDLGFSGTLSYELLARINTLVSQGKAKVRANPHIITIEGKQAEIYVGKEEYYLINVGGTAQAYYTLQSIATGVILKITPYVDKNNQITVTITPEVSEVVGKGATNLPVITKRTAATTLRVNDNQTIAIGGLVQEQTSETISRVPFLGAIPLLGIPFRHKLMSTQNKEVIIFITPRLLGKGLKHPQDAGAGAREEIAFNDQVKAYYLEISKIIDDNKKLLVGEGLDVKGPKEVLLEFTVFSSGTVGEARVLHSSGIHLFDLNAVRLIENLSPFPAFPKGISSLSITFVIPIRYES